MKDCTRCKLPVELEGFYKDRRSSDGRRSRCKKCCNIDNRKWVINNRSKATEYSRNWRKANPEKCKASLLRCKEARAVCSKNYREAHREDLRVKSREYYLTHKGKCNARSIRDYQRRRKEFLNTLPANTGDSILYIMESEGFYKVGISQVVPQRLKSIQHMSGLEIQLIAMYVTLHGRSVDTESMIHLALKDYQISMSYQEGTTSREWFNAPLDIIKNEVNKHTKEITHE